MAVSGADVWRWRAGEIPEYWTGTEWSPVVTNGSPTITGDATVDGTLSVGGSGAVTGDEFGTLDGLTATTAELNKMDGVTATTTELNYVDGVTSNIQTQLNNKANISGSTGQVFSIASADRVACPSLYNTYSCPTRTILAFLRTCCIATAWGAFS